MKKLRDLYKKIRDLAGIKTGIYTDEYGLITDDLKLKEIPLTLSAYPFAEFTEISKAYIGLKCMVYNYQCLLILPNDLKDNLLRLIELLVENLMPDENIRLSRAIRGELIDFALIKQMESSLPCWIYGLYHQGNSQELVEFLKQFYPDDRAVIMSENEIVVFSKNDIIADDVHSIYDSAQTELFLKLSIIQGDYINTWEELLSAYCDLNDIHGAVKLINNGHGVFKKSEILAPWLINKIEKDKILTITQGLKRNWQEKLSDELLITAKSFFNNNLNITDTANKLYLHRNTLIYRLNKIEKITGYDIRKFHDGINFYLILLCDSVGRIGE